MKAKNLLKLTNNDFPTKIQRQIKVLNKYRGYLTQCRSLAQLREELELWVDKTDRILLDHLGDNERYSEFTRLFNEMLPNDWDSSHNEEVFRAVLYRIVDLLRRCVREEK